MENYSVFLAADINLSTSRGDGNLLSTIIPTLVVADTNLCTSRGDGNQIGVLHWFFFTDINLYTSGEDGNCMPFDRTH